MADPGSGPRSTLRQARRSHAEARLALWGAWTEARVTRASPLLLEAVASGGIDLAQAAARLKPPAGWPGRDARRAATEHLMPEPAALVDWLNSAWARMRSASDPRVRAFDTQLAQRHRRAGGLLLRGIASPAGALAIRPARRGLEMEATLGTAVLATAGDRATVWLDGAMSDASLASAMFRPVSDLVPHPLLADRAYRILGAWRSGFGDGTMVTIAAPAVPHGLPPGWTGRAAAGATRRGGTDGNGG